MSLYIFDNGSTLGPLEEDDVIQQLNSQRFSLQTMACRVGEDQWRPLREVVAPIPTTKTSFVDSSTATKPVSIKAGDLMHRMVDHISSAAGVERLEKQATKGMFSEVWRKRSADEIEAYFSVGTPTNTPALAQIDASWPRPWAFCRVFIGSMLAFAGLYYMVLHFSNPLSIPSVLMVGAFAVPCSILVLFFEFNTPRNFSLYQTLRLTSLGGIVSLVTCLFFYNWADGVGLASLGASFAGIVEEPAKLLAMLIVANNVRYRWTLNGLLIGACVGTGFAVVETAGYAFEGLVKDMQGGELQTEGTLFIRALLYPLGGHALLSAIVGAALWRVKGSQRFSWSMLQDSRFLRLFVIAVVLHAIWNAPFELPFFGKYLAVGFVSWLIILSLVQAGLKEIRLAQQESAPPPVSKSDPVAV